MIIDTLTLLNQNTDINQQIQILFQLWDNKQFWFFEGTKMGLSYNYKLKLDKVPKLEEDDEVGTLTYNDFIILYQKLSKEYNKDLLYKAIETANALEWNIFYRKILLKEIDWITKENFNNIVQKITKSDTRAKQFLIEDFQLPTLKTSKISNLVGNYYLEPYVQGDRMIMQFIDKNIKCYNNNGLEIDFGINLIHDLPVDIVFDGIVINKKYYIFDLIPYQDFVNDKCLLPLNERVEILSQFVGYFQEKEPNIKIVEKIELSLPTDIVNEYLEILKNESYTHFVAKATDSLYSRKDKNNWLKCKIA